MTLLNLERKTSGQLRAFINGVGLSLMWVCVDERRSINMSVDKECTMWTHAFGQAEMQTRANGDGKLQGD